MMFDRRQLTLAGLAALTVPTAGCDQIGRLGVIGRKDIQNAGQSWSYARIGDRERFELRPDDYWRASEHKERTEVGVYRFAKWREPVWLSYSFMVEPGPVSTAPWLMLGQWHAFKDPWDAGLWPPVAQYLAGDRMRIQTASDAKIRQVSNPIAVDRYVTPGFQRGTWHSFVSRLRFDPFGKGDFQVWLDGAHIVDAGNIPLGYNDLVGPYFKYGLYRPVGDPSTVVAWYANMEIGAASLTDRITRPRPV